MKKWFMLLICIMMLCTSCQKTDEQESGNKEFNVLDYLDAEESEVREALEMAGFTIEEVDAWCKGFCVSAWRIQGKVQTTELKGALMFWQRDGKNCLAEYEYYYMPEEDTAFVKSYFQDCIDRYGDPQGWDNMYASDLDAAAAAKDYLENIEEYKENTANMFWLRDPENPMESASFLTVTYQYGENNQREIFVKGQSPDILSYDGV